MRVPDVRNVAVLRAMFVPKDREGQSLAGAVELAEELARRGERGAQALLGDFFSEATGFKDDMVEVAAGAFPFGDSSVMVHVPAFSIDRHLVTNREYERMIPGHRGLRDVYSDSDEQPVIYVNWYEARLYCRWRCGCRLPTEQEWEKAAAWDPASEKKRIYPWGDEFDSARCNTNEGGRGKTSPVGTYPEGRSAFGCDDMAGNVWEWTESFWVEDQPNRVLRGGSWSYNLDIAACACRGGYYPHDRGNYVGFCCART